MTENRVSEVRTTQKEPERERRIFTFKATQLVWLVFGILEAMIALRIGLLLLGANPGSPIVNFIYGFTAIFLYPFKDLVGSPTSGNMVLEISSLFAMLIYGLIAWVVAKVVWLIFYRPRAPLVGVTETTSSDQRTNR